MKVSASKHHEAHVSENTAILPLVPVPVKYPKDKLLSFKLRTQPADADSPTYEIRVPINSGNESVRETIEWMRNVHKVFVGMNAANDAAQQDGLIRRTISDAALTAYHTGSEGNRERRWSALKKTEREAGVTAGDDEATIIAAVARVARPDVSTLDIDEGIHCVIDYAVPYKGLQRQKRYMRRKCRKPAEMSAREFFNHFTRINDQELPMMPPNFDRDQSLSADEVVDIMLHAFPSSWNAEMERQGFDAFEKTPMEILDFCERIEASEKVNNPVKGKSNGSSSKKSSSNGSRRSSSNDNGSYYCKHHGKNTSHDTEDCKVLQSNKKHKGGNSSSSGKHANKSWSRKAEHNKDNSKRELAALMKKAVRKELHALSKKRKESDDDDQSVASINAMDDIDIDLSEFDYTNMGNLKIDSDDSSMDEGEIPETEAEA